MLFKGSKIIHISCMWQEVNGYYFNTLNQSLLPLFSINYIPIFDCFQYKKIQYIFNTS